jgi:hypothetical protein
MKNENPGWDLLLNVDWEQALATAGLAAQSVVNSAPVVEPVASQMNKGPEIVKISAEVREEREGGKTGVWLVVAGLAGVVFLAAAVRRSLRK